jgi:hypothetical protein
MSAVEAEPVLEVSERKVTTADMLYKVFPKKVADKLQAGLKVEPYVYISVFDPNSKRFVFSTCPCCLFVFGF